jgi:hypothetical protein
VREFFLILTRFLLILHAHHRPLIPSAVEKAHIQKQTDVDVLVKHACRYCILSTKRNVYFSWALLAPLQLLSFFLLYLDHT